MRMLFFAPSSVILKFVMKPSSLRIRATSIFSLEAGTSTLGWRASAALRIRVSMSPIGSDVPIVLLPRLYQLALITPGTSPAKASFRKQIRHKLNLRRYPRGRPHRKHRLRCRILYFNFFDSRAILAVVAIFLILPRLP